MAVFHTIASVLGLVVALMTLSVGIRFLTAKEYFSYHKAIVGKEWNEIDASIRMVLLAVFKMTASGIIVISFVLFYSVGKGIFINENTLMDKVIPPSLCLLFWVGSFLTTFSVHKKTNANTPWKGSLLCLILLSICIIFSTLYYRC